MNLEPNKTINQELQDELLKIWAQRADIHGLSGKREITDQCHFITGAIVAIDKLLGNTKTCIPAKWYVHIIRGELIKP